jgi:hypothetical protein
VSMCVYVVCMYVSLCISSVSLSLLPLLHGSLFCTSGAGILSNGHTHTRPLSLSLQLIPLTRNIVP